MVRYHEYRGARDYGEDHVLTNNWNPDEDYGNEYVFVRFDIDARHYRYPYNRYDGYEEDKAKYDAELLEIFWGLGWNIKTYGSFMSCATVIKDEDRQELYLHPQQFSGVIKKNDIKATAERLDRAETFSLRFVELFETYYEMSDEEYRAALEEKKSAAAEKLFRNASTTRRNKFWDEGSVVINTAKTIHINRIRPGIVDSRFSPSKEEKEFVQDIVNEMTDRGYLLEAEIDGVMYVRSLNKTELKKKDVSQKAKAVK